MFSFCPSLLISGQQTLSRNGQDFQSPCSAKPDEYLSERAVRSDTEGNRVAVIEPGEMLVRCRPGGWMPFRAADFED